MDGHDLSRRLAQMLNDESSGWLDSRTTYDFIYEAAVALVDRTGCLKTTQDITTVADTSEYNIKPDYLRLYLKNNSEELIVKYNDGTNEYFLPWKDYEDIVFANQTDSVAIPSFFSIVDAALPAQVASTATAAGAATGGLSTLTDSTAPFANVEAGDIVHNTTDGSSGVVISKTSTSAIKTALFGGTANDWTNADDYIIQPQGRLKLVLDAPTETAGETITLYYVQKPEPVYHDYGVYRILSHYQTALLKYALWLYKYRDRSPNTGDALYRFWETETQRAGNSINQAIRPNSVKVSFHGRR